MNDNQAKIKALQDRMDLLVQRQKTFIIELKQLREEIRTLQAEEQEVTKKQSNPPSIKTIPKTTFFDRYSTEKKEPITTTSVDDDTEKATIKQPAFEVNLEKFIGENLISKIGILITIIGVAIGAKYSIDNDLISPLTRIVLGYLVGIGLMGFGIKLKEKYLNYSAVLVSGSIAILYFITFIAYDFYDLFPQLIAFGLMVLFTIFAVIAAISYDKQVIAHIGLVGAYAVPFFLSNGSGDIFTFFSYITIINIGILVISFRKYWKKLFYAAFAQTWIIYLVWLFLEYNETRYFNLALGFSTLFFLIFYATFLAYKLIKKENFNFGNVIVLLFNSFIYYGLGFLLINNFQFSENYSGLFTLGNAIIHFIVGNIVYRQKLYDKQLFYLVIGLVLVFITMAIPVQLDGNWVTLLWITQTVLLFWIGRTRSVPFYEKIAFILLVLSTLSIIDDLTNAYSVYGSYGQLMTIQPIFNIHFLTSIIFILAISFMSYLHHNKKYQRPEFIQMESLKAFFDNGLGILLLLSIYLSLYLEITNYFNRLYQKSVIKIEADYATWQYNENIFSYQTIWIMIYTMIFLTVLSFIDIKKIKNAALGFMNICLTALMILIFLVAGVLKLSELQLDYYMQDSTDLFRIGSSVILLKYLSFAVLGLLIFTTYQYIKAMSANLIYKKIFEVGLSIVLIWLISTEFLVWMQTIGASTSSKLGLSIIWGIYALLIISYGIWKQKKHLRIMAIALFALTLIKLFLYDLSHLNTISKTIVLVALGILLLIISFLYNKYKTVIFGDD